MATHLPPLNPSTLNVLKTQVGGHSLILEIDKDYVCKPMVDREVFFYENLPEPLRSFTPTYIGEVEVYQNGDSHYSLINHHSPISNGSTCSVTPEGGRTSPDHSSLSDHSHKDCNNDNTMSIDKSMAKLNVAPNIGQITTLSCDDFDKINGTLPWTRRANNKLLNGRSLVHTKGHSHIILENLTGKFKRPCVIDLKLGTRSYSDIMSEEKKQMHALKCANTTSKGLGVRLGGMQLYCPQEDGGKYYMMDKYFGRSLTSDGFFQVLSDFFYQGIEDTSISNHLVSKLLDKLKQLRAVVQDLDSYRFYSSSLLIFYEGCDHKEACHLRDIVDVRMIDFSNVTCKHFDSDQVVYDGPDEGYIKGLTTIITYYEHLLSTNCHH